MASPMTSSHLTLSDLKRSNSRSLWFRSLISCKGAELGHMLLLNINRKSYTRSPMTSSFLTLSDLESSNSRSLRFWSIVSCKRAELGHMLPLNINRKIYMGSPMTLSHLTSVTLTGQYLERSISRSLRIWNLISRKGAEIGKILILNINRKAYMDSPMTLSDLTASDLERSISKSLRFQRLISRKATELGHMLLLNINRKSYMGSPIPPSDLTLSDLDRSKLRCRKWSKIDTCIVRYCLRVNPRFQLIYKSAENCRCHINCSYQAERQGPWTSCFRFPQHGTLWEPKFQSATPPTNCSWKFSNFSWFFSMVLTKPLLGFLKFWN